MASDISIALIGVASALLGTTAGGVISYYSNKETRKSEWKSSIIREEINEKKKLYSEFLSEATRLTWIAFETKSSNLKDFHLLGDLTAQIELFGSEQVVKASKEILDCVTSLHTEPPTRKVASFYEAKTVFINEVKREIQSLADGRLAT